jgi:DNA-binding response OmpR family regulator
MMKGKRVLIVESELIVAEDLKNIVEAHGYQVEDIVTSGSEAIERLRTIAPDILLFNVSSDGLDGTETSQVLRSLKTVNVGVILITATLSRGFSGLDYLKAVVIEKPFTDESVVRALWFLQNAEQNHWTSDPKDQNHETLGLGTIQNQENIADGN